MEFRISETFTDSLVSLTKGGADGIACWFIDTSRPFDKPESGRIAVKVINHLGDEVMKVFGVD